MRVWGPDFGSGNRHTGQDLVPCHLVPPGEPGAPQTQKSKELQSPRARERGERPPQAFLVAKKQGPQQAAWEGPGPVFRLRERLFVAVVFEL